MNQQRWRRGIVVVSLFLATAGCVTEQAPPPTASHVQQTIPADSPFAKIREGMGIAELTSLLGQPTDQESSITGKAFIPFYFGGDASMSRLHYKGLGRVYVSGGALFGGGGRVIKIEYDPQESGFRK